MSSPELLQLVQDCPSGAETLIMRMLHILTENGQLVYAVYHEGEESEGERDRERGGGRERVAAHCMWTNPPLHIFFVISVDKAAPSPELVRRVRELYQRNSSDVRFLIPVLHGLQKVCLVDACLLALYFAMEVKC